jgi:HxlR-like helix-turn-helix
MLAQQLRELEGDGIVHRAVYDEIPPRVEYSLTEVGVALNAALAPVGDWGEQRLTQLGLRPTPRRPDRNQTARRPSPATAEPRAFTDPPAGQWPGFAGRKDHAVEHRGLHPRRPIKQAQRGAGRGWAMAGEAAFWTARSGHELELTSRGALAGVSR